MKMAPARVSRQGRAHGHVGAVSQVHSGERELLQGPSSAEAQEEIARYRLDVKAADLEQVTDSSLIAEPPLEVDAFAAQLEQWVPS